MKMASGSIDLISKFVLHVQEGGIVVCAFQRFCFLCSCWLLFFHCLSFSPCWPLAFLIFSPPLWNFHVFFPKEIRLLCLQSLALALSLCYPREKKDTTLLFFFLSKSPGGHAISFQIKPWVPFGFPYLLIELFYIGAPVVRSVRRSVGLTVTWLPKFFRMHRLPNFLGHGAPLQYIAHGSLM